MIPRNRFVIGTYIAHPKTNRFTQITNKFEVFDETNQNKPFKMLKICGPKLSLCFVIVSVWGIIQLVLMGLFYHMKSVALFEDLGLEGEFENADAFYEAADQRYVQSAQNCWIAACLYIFTLLVAGQQFHANNSSNLSV